MTRLENDKEELIRLIRELNNESVLEYLITYVRLLKEVSVQ